MITSIDVNATFNPAGDFKPLYVRMEDERHELHTYKIHAINQIKDENNKSSNARVFYCSIVESEIKKEIVIRYNFQSHKWSLLEE